MAEQNWFTFTQLVSAIRPEHVRAALAELDAGVQHPFGAATIYELVEARRPYDPKAVVGLAYRQATGILPNWDQLKGGPENANRVLERLGFLVRKISDSVEGTDWTDDECRLIVADYFDMLSAELLDDTYNKAEHNRRLRLQLNRSRGSVERKHMNISAVMVELALPYIDGYKPNVNRQELLAETVEHYVEEHPDFFDVPQIENRIEPKALAPVVVASAAGCFEEPPDAEIPTRPPRQWKSRRGRLIDFSVRDAMNRALGELGEQFAVDLERQRLREASRDDLAERVEWASKTRGDGLGFDVVSFDELSDEEKWLEVKTTALPKFHPFIVTQNELACSEAEPARFCLYRVFDYRIFPRVFRLHGSLRLRCALEPLTYRAGPPYRVS